MRPRAGEWLAGASGAVLVASLFLPWYGGRSAWSAFAAIDLVLLAAALVALALLAVTVARAGSPVRVAAGSCTVLAGVVATLLVAFRALLPAASEGRAPGLYLGLLAAIAMVAAGLASLDDERE